MKRDLKGKNNRAKKDTKVGKERKAKRENTHKDLKIDIDIERQRKNLETYRTEETGKKDPEKSVADSIKPFLNVI